jgi:hypothetical protein
LFFTRETLFNGLLEAKLMFSIFKYKLNRPQTRLPDGGQVSADLSASGGYTQITSLFINLKILLPSSESGNPEFGNNLRPSASKKELSIQSS